MENNNFKDFNYQLIDSSLPKYKEVLVSFSFNDQSIKEFIFINEAKNKSDNYYINEAKKVINRKIKSGELVKSADKQVAHRNKPKALKPVLITLAGVVAAGGLATGTYFIGRHVENNAQGYTVILSAGEDAYFINSATESNSLVLTNVAKGTSLADIEGYILPISRTNMDFENWTIDGSETVFNVTTKITSNISLTATYSENLESIRENAIKDIRACYEILVDNIESQETIAALRAFTITMTTNQNNSPLLITDDKDTATYMRDFIIKSLIAVAFCKSESARIDMMELIDYEVQDILYFQLGEQSVEKAAARAAIASAYLGAIINPDMTDETFIGEVKQQLLASFYDSDDKNKAKIVELIAEGVLFTAVYVPNDAILKQEYQLYIGTSVDGIIDANRPDKINLVNDLSELTNDFYNALSKIADRNDFSAVRELYEAARDFYINSTETPAEILQYELYKQSLKDIATATVSPISKLANDIKNAMSDFVVASAPYINDPDGANKIAIFEYICEKRLKAISTVNDDGNLANLCSLLKDAAEATNFDPHIINFIKMAMDTAANMPDANSDSYKKLYAKYDALYANANKAFGNLKVALAISDTDPKREEKISYINEVNEGLVRSTQYANINMIDYQQEKPLAALYDEVTEGLLDSTKFDIAPGQYEGDALFYSSYCLNICKEAAKFPDFVSTFQNTTQTVSSMFMMFRTDSSYTDEDELWFGQMSKDYLSNAFETYDFCLSLNRQNDYQNAIINRLTSIPNNLIGQLKEKWKNEVKCNALLAANKDYFVVYNNDQYDPNGAFKRYDYLSQNSWLLGEHYDAIAYDEILDMWKNDFFANITRTTEFSEVQTLAKAAHEKSNEIYDKYGPMPDPE